jgi:hypothetical protein
VEEEGWRTGGGRLIWGGNEGKYKGAELFWVLVRQLPPWLRERRLKERERERFP